MGYLTLKHPIATEKAIRLMEQENKLIFVVDKKANKQQIKDSFKHYFDIEPTKVNTMVRSDGIKRAVITLPMDKPAIDIATSLGML